MNTNPQKLHRIVSTVLPCLLSPCLIICISGILFVLTDFTLLALSKLQNTDYSLIMMSICFIASVLASCSIIRVTVKHNKELRNKYWASDLKKCFSFIFKQSKLPLESAIIAIIYVILPINVTLPALASLLKIDNRLIEKLVALAIILPLLFIAEILSNLSACSYWQKCRNEKFYGKKVFKKDALSICCAYISTEYFIISVIPFIDSNQHIFRKLLTAKFILIILVPIVITISYIYLRAILQRKKCIKQLQKICQDQGYTLSEIRYPYRSVFKVCEGESFKFTVKNKTYSCKFIGKDLSSNPLVLSPNGTLVYLDQNPLRVTTLYKFGYKSDYPQILIVNPTPKHVYTTQGEDNLVKIDNGDRVGNYKFYTASAFLRALELNVMDK